MIIAGTDADDSMSLAYLNDDLAVANYLLEQATAARDA